MTAGDGTARALGSRLRGPHLTAVSWYEQSPRMSLEMIDLAGIEPQEAVLDVGGGASPFAGALLARGFADVTVLDLSEVAVRASRAELGPAAARVAWIRADILDWTPERTYGLWHDRADRIVRVRVDDWPADEAPDFEVPTNELHAAPTPA